MDTTLNPVSDYISDVTQKVRVQAGIVAIWVESTPFSPPSGPATGFSNGPHPKSKFLAFIAAGTIAASARFRGLLLAPGSWQGEFVAEATSLSARIAGHDAKFDRGNALAVLHGGTLSCLDARLIGDDLSLLGNATVLADGQIAAVLRLVAPPETLSAITSRAFSNCPQPPVLTLLATPQRAALDLELSGQISNLSLRLGREGPVISH